MGYGSRLRLRQGVSALIAFTCTTLLASSALAQFSQYGPKLVPSDATGVGGLGASVAISGDGTTFIAGAPAADGEVGGAWVWSREVAGLWTQQSLKLVGSGGSGKARQGTDQKVQGTEHPEHIVHGLLHGIPGSRFIGRADPSSCNAVHMELIRAHWS